MKTLNLYLLSGLVMMTPVTAQAYCCWNEAICKAVCGFRCCGANDFVSTSGTEALAGINTSDLEREVEAAQDCNPKIRNAMSRQLRTAPGKPPAMRYQQR